MLYLPHPDPLFTLSHPALCPERLMFCGYVKVSLVVWLPVEFVQWEASTDQRKGGIWGICSLVTVLAG